MARLPDGGWRLAPLNLAVGSSAVEGDVTWSQGLASGRLSVKSSDLDDFSPLLLQKLGGRLDAALTFDATAGRQNARIEAKAAGLRSSVFAAARLDAALAISDAVARPVVDGQISIDRAAFAGQIFERLLLRAKGAAGASALSMAIQARGWSMTGAGVLVAQDAPHLDLASLDLRGRGHRIELAAPTVLKLRDGVVQTERLALAVDSGRLEIAGRVGRALDLAISAKSLPLAAAGLIASHAGLSGAIEGEAHVSGAFPALSGDWRLNVTRLSSAATRSAGLPPVEASGSGGFERAGVRFSARVAAGANSSIRVAGFAPFIGEDLDLTAKGALDAALAAPLLPDGDKLAGKVALDLRASGSLAKPLVKGSTVMSGGSFADATSGLRVSELAVRLVAQGDHLQIEQLSAQTSGGGSLSVSGRIDLAAGAGFPGELRIKADRARLFANDLGTAAANMTLEASGPLARRPQLHGRVDIVTMELAVPDRLPQTLKPLPNLRLIHPAPAAAARLALTARQKAVASRPLPFDADIDLAISAANRIFVRGRGLDAEFGGQVGLTGSLRKPIARGGFDLRRGSLDFLTKRLDLSSGRLTFAGGLIPDLDVAAQAVSGGITAQITVAGPANEPIFSFSSTPALPQDEILSRILFAKPSGGLSPLQALQVAELASQLAGAGNGAGMFDKMRKSLGVDSFDVQSDASGNAQVGVSRYINDHMSLGLKTGANPQDSAVSLGVDVTKRLRAQGELGADGSSSVGLGMEWEY